MEARFTIPALGANTGGGRSDKIADVMKNLRLPIAVPATPNGFAAASWGADYWIIGWGEAGQVEFIRVYPAIEIIL